MHIEGYAHRSRIVDKGNSVVVRYNFGMHTGLKQQVKLFCQLIRPALQALIMTVYYIVGLLPAKGS